MTRFPSIKAVAAELMDAKRWCGETEDGWIDVRLQVREDGRWAVHTGDSQYDQDHRGYWGASSLSSQSNCKDVARDLIEEARDHHAQSMG